MVFSLNGFELQHTGFIALVEVAQDALLKHETDGLQFGDWLGHGFPVAVLLNLNHKALCPLGNFFHIVLLLGAEAPG
jgi:hypothetical protein